MQIYMAPLEGVTGFVFRNAYEKYYGGVDKYFTPFITPHTKKNMDQREKRDILPENNEGMNLIPQVLTNNAEELLSISEELKSFGYEEINLNIGCPSGTVTAKKKGAGFLADIEELDHFFLEYFEHANVKLSIKTRIGMYAPDEWQELFEVFEKYPFSEVIVHPRAGKEFYLGLPHYDIFSDILEQTKHSICFNGNIFSLSDFEEKQKVFSKCEKYMLGRGLLWNPQLAGEIQKGRTEMFDKERFMEFHEEILKGYESYISGDRNVLFRMKELWGYWNELFDEQKKLKKEIRKSGTLEEYRKLVALLR